MNGGSSVLRVAVWAIHVAIPLLGLWLLVAQPDLDLRWEDLVSHFWLVAAVAGINIGVGFLVSRAAGDHGDARLFLVSLAFLASAGFFLLHALATPTVITDGPNIGFAIASPAGVLVFAGFAAASAIELSPVRAQATMRRRAWLSGAVIAVLAAWAAFSLFELTPFRGEPDPDTSLVLTRAAAAAGILLFGFATVRYFVSYRRRPSVMLLSLITAFVLLAESLVAMAVSLTRAWQASWWEWHVLMVMAFAFVAYSARVQFRREGSATGLFQGISLQETIRKIREEHAEALEALVQAIHRREEGQAGDSIATVAHRLGDRFGLTEGQAQVLERAAEALLAERQQIHRLGALVAVGQESRVIVEEAELVRRAISIIGDAFGRDSVRVGLVESGRLRFPAELATGADSGSNEIMDRTASAATEASRPVETDLDGSGAVLALPITVKDRAAGVLVVGRPDRGFHERDRSVLESLASQLSISLENARLYRQLDTLFRQYMSPGVATALLADPAQAALGGGTAEVTVLFADLRGFTSFSERRSPEEIVGMLNRYFGIAVPVALEAGGTVDKFVGDAIMALWGAPVRQPDHSLRAARSALTIQRAIEEVVEGHPGWPRFRIGLNTGPALIGNIGSAELRNFTAIGDTVNLASRLETAAEPGQIVIGEATYAAVKDVAVVTRLSPIEVKGKEQPVQAYVLADLQA